MPFVRERHNDTIEFHLQIVTGAFVSPDCKEVLPLCPELIRRQDGSTKNDCERNATRRFFADIRREHLHPKVIVTEDGLSANVPHIKDLTPHDLRYILSAKPGDHAYMFSQVDEAAEQGEVIVLNRFSWVTDLEITPDNARKSCVVCVPAGESRTRPLIPSRTRVITSATATAWAKNI